jgi:L-arabinokinase
VREAFGLPRDERLALVSFGGYGVHGLDLEALSRLEGYRIVMSGATPIGARSLQDVGPRGSLIPLDEPAMYARGYRYEDIVRAVDVVVTKPGYGIIAECLANDSAILYTSRGHFAEYEVLVAGMPRYLRAGFIGHDDLFAANWRPHLDRLLAQPAPPECARVDGAEVAAARLLSIM